MKLQNKVAIVTGGGTGIGEAIAHKFAREGAKVVVAGLPTDPVEDVADAIRKAGGEAISCGGDLSDEHNAQACVNTALAAFGKLDILVNNAGVFTTFGPTDRYPVDDFDYLVRNNLRTAFLMTKFALPHLRKTYGNIISAGSEAGFNGTENFSAYGGTKAFIHSFVKAVALENAKFGVRANCVCPGPIHTAWLENGESPIPGKQLKEIEANTPMGRMGTPEEIANVYAFLASDEASYVTAALWLVDGGITPGKGGGDKVPKNLRKEPVDELPLRHSLDGLKNKEVRQLA